MMAANSHDASSHSPHSPHSPSSSLQSPNEYCPGLEVGIQNPDGHGPILVPDTPDAIVDHGKWPEAMEIAPGSRSTGENGLIPHEEKTEEKKKLPATICGVRKNIYLWIALLIMLVLIGAIVGGAVGGTRAARNNNSSSQATAPPTNTTIPPPTRTATSSGLREIPPANPSATAFMTFKLQTWEGLNFTGRSQFFYRPGGYHSPWTVLSYIWQPNVPGELDDPNKLRCGVVFCTDTEFYGWWGRSSRNINNTLQFNNGTIGKKPFNVMNIVCDRDWFDLEGGCPEKEALSTFATIAAIAEQTSARTVLSTSGSSSSAPTITSTSTRTSSVVVGESTMVTSVTSRGN